MARYKRAYSGAPKLQRPVGVSAGAINATATPSVVNAVTSIPTPVIQISVLITPSVVQAVTSIPAPTFSVTYLSRPVLSVL